jgi:hypothetical protein
MTRFLYIDTDRQRQGPIDEQQLQALMAQGVIRPDTLVKSESGWQGPASEIPVELLPPPLPDTEPDSVPLPSYSIYKFKKILLWTLFAISCLVTCFSSWFALPAAIIFLCIASVEEKLTDPLRDIDKVILILLWILFGISCLATLFWTWYGLFAAFVFWCAAVTVERGIEERRLLECAEQGDTQAQYDLAGKCESSGKLDEAQRWYEEAARAGHTDAQSGIERVKDRQQEKKERDKIAEKGENSKTKETNTKVKKANWTNEGICPVCEIDLGLGDPVAVTFYVNCPQCDKRLRCTGYPGRSMNCWVVATVGVYDWIGWGLEKINNELKKH